MPFTEDHKQFRQTLRRFVEREIAPHVAVWDEQGGFPRDLYRKAAEIGLFSIGYPEAYGGTPGDIYYLIVVADEIARAGSGGVRASLLSHAISMPIVASHGPDWMKDEVLTAVIAGEKISALAITEPAGGSDVSALRTRAERDGDHFIVTGEKTFITSGMRADYFVTAVRTGSPGDGRDGLSLLLVEGGTPGLTRTPLNKMGWWASDTAQLRFDGCRVPARNLIGPEHQGFALMMANFNKERIGLAASATAFAQVCLDEAVDWARMRVTFGKPLIERQVIRHKLVDMTMRIEASRSFLEQVAQRHEDRSLDDKTLSAQIGMLKIFATRTLQHCADEAVQILGGMGYMRGNRVERIYREVKVNMIGGGSEEILKDLASRQLGW
jgi:acyl-CoA dehydrogenase